MATERSYEKSRDQDDALYVLEQTVDELAHSYERPLPEVNQARDSQTRPEASGDAAAWYGGLRHSSEVVAVLSNGWAEGARRLEQLRSALAVDVPAAQSRRRRSRWSDDGDALDPDRALAGQWDTAFRSTRREFSSGTTVVELLVSWGGNSNRTAEELFWCGAQMLALADILEAAGYSVRLTAVSTAIVRDEGVVCAKVVVKDAGEALRIDALAGVVCHAGIFRTLGFRAICSAPFAVGAGLGHSTSLASVRHLLERHGEWPAEDSVIVPHAYDRATAITNIQTALSGLQGTSEAA